MSISHNIEEILNWNKTQLDGDAQNNEDNNDDEKKEGEGEGEEENNRPEWPTYTQLYEN